MNKLEDKAIPTIEQQSKIDEITAKGYKWDKGMSVAAAGVVMKKGNDIYFFGLDGEIMHNPKGYTIKC